MDCDSRILNVLKQYPNGLGVRELKRKTSEKCVRNWLSKLYDMKYIKYKNPDAKLGQTKIVLITDKGRSHAKLLREIEKIEIEFLKKFGVSSLDNISILQFEKELDLYEKLLTDIFDISLKADSKIAIRFLNTTLFAVRKVLDKKRYDIDTHKLILETIRNALLKP